MQSVFARGVVDGVRCFAVRDARRRDAAACEWLLRVRTPVRVCPRGSPLLVLDAYDHRAAVRLHRSGRLDFATSLQDRCRLLDVAPDDPVRTFGFYFAFWNTSRKQKTGSQRVSDDQTESS